MCVVGGLPLGDVIRQCDGILEQSEALDATSIPEMRNPDVFTQHVNVETHKPAIGQFTVSEHGFHATSQPLCGNPTVSHYVFLCATTQI